MAAANNKRKSASDNDREPILDRMPPSDGNAERSVLGSMMIDPEAVGKAVELLQPEDFYKGSHREIFAAMVERFSVNEPVDILTIGSNLNRSGKLEEVGGNYYLAELANQVASAANVEYHARIVLEKSMLRRLISISTAGWPLKARKKRPI